MPDTNPYSAPSVQDKSSKPVGILPSHTQSLVIGGIALLMLLVIVFSGKNPPKGQKSSTEPQRSLAVDPSDERIKEYRDRIDEQSRKLLAEQKQWTQVAQGIPRPNAQSAAGIAPAPQPHFVGAQSYAAYPVPDPERTWLESEREKRNYLSLFASNMALSHRREERAANSSSPEVAPVETSDGRSYVGVLARTLPAIGSEPTGQDEGAWEEPASSPDETQDSNETRIGSARPAKSRIQNKFTDLDRANGKEYRLFEGTVFETVLTNRLDGSFSGPVNCMVTTNVYSHDHARLLIPQGSRVLGEVRKVEALGQQRLALSFHRLLMPDGYSVSLDKLQGLSQIGETGLVDQINHHYLQLFGVSLAIGMVAGLSQSNTSYGANASATDAYRQGVASSLSQTSLHILDRFLNVLPTFTIREGHRVKIYLTNDLLLPAYEKHEMPSDL